MIKGFPESSEEEVHCFLVVRYGECIGDSSEGSFKSLLQYCDRISNIVRQQTILDAFQVFISNISNFD
jgi:hypothetical protein